MITSRIENEKLFFCTLFDINYLSRGLSLYDSLMQNAKNFSLYVLAMDDICYAKLISLKLSNMIVVSLNEFENEELKIAKSNRSRVEYFWTSAAAFILHVLKNFDVNMCAYLDSDVYFFSDPQIIFQEVNKQEDKSVLIINHNFHQEYDISEKVGTYNISIVAFMNCNSALEVLEEWCQKCLDWCYDCFEEAGKYGNQKYLDEWPKRYRCVYISANPGGGLAPWNAKRFPIENDTPLHIIDLKNGNKYPFIFFHFHSMTFFDKDVVRLANQEYYIDEQYRRKIYGKYLRKLNEVIKKYSLANHETHFYAAQHFRDDVSTLVNDRNYYRLSSFEHGSS